MQSPDDDDSLVMAPEVDVQQLQRNLSDEVVTDSKNGDAAAGSKGKKNVSFRSPVHEAGGGEEPEGPGPGQGGDVLTVKDLIDSVESDKSGELGECPVYQRNTFLFRGFLN